MLVLWRRTFKAAASGESRPAFVQAVVAAPTFSPIAAAAQLSEGVSRPSRIEIVLAHDRCIIDPHDGQTFVSRGRRGDLVKLLWHDGQGMCLFSKKLERGRFLWSSVADGVVTITQAQLGYLLEGDRLAPFAENLAAARRRLKDCWGQRGWRLPCGKQR